MLDGFLLFPVDAEKLPSNGEHKNKIHRENEENRKGLIKCSEIR